MTRAYLWRQPSQVLHIPEPQQVSQNGNVITGCVRFSFLRHGSKVIKEGAPCVALSVLPVVHEVGRHHNLPPHHRFQRQHRV